jgi:hypothetical protein
VIWEEIKKLVSRSILAQWVEITAERVTAPGDSFAEARTATAPVNLQGYHAPPDRLLFVIDESTGVSDAIYEVVQGALSSINSRCLAMSNPTKPEGWYFDLYQSPSSRWSTYTVSAFDVPHRVGADFVDDIRQTYGEGSPAWQIRVLGQFPTQSEDSLIPYSWVEGAILPGLPLDNFSTKDFGAGIIVGLDVGASGHDPSAVVVRQGRYVHTPYLAEWYGLTNTALAGKVTNLLKQLEPLSPLDPNTNERLPVKVAVDVIGVGSGVAPLLKQNGVQVIPVCVSESSPPPRKGQPKCYRLRDRLYWEARDAFGPDNDQKHIILKPQDKAQKQLVGKLVEELTTANFEFLSSGAVKIEAKDQMKKRLGRSPNLCDAYLCSLYKDNWIPKQRDEFGRYFRGRRSKGGDSYLYV